MSRAIESQLQRNCQHLAVVTSLLASSGCEDGCLRTVDVRAVVHQLVWTRCAGSALAARHCPLLRIWGPQLLRWTRTPPLAIVDQDDLH